MQAFRDAAVVVEHDFSLRRQTGVTLEPRVIVADFDPRPGKADRSSFASGAVPDARDFRGAARACRFHHVQVVTPDVGGAFGMKLSAYPDEMAVAALAVLLGRPVKFIADRLEFVRQRRSCPRGDA